MLTLTYPFFPPSLPTSELCKDVCIPAPAAFDPVKDCEHVCPVIIRNVCTLTDSGSFKEFELKAMLSEGEQCKHTKAMLQMDLHNVENEYFRLLGKVEGLKAVRNDTMHLIELGNMV